MTQTLRQVILLSPYRGASEPRHGSSYALERYCSDLVDALLKFDPSLEITVLADDPGFADDTTSTRLTVQRVWARNSLRSGRSITRAIKAVGTPAAPLVAQFEVAIFGAARHGIAVAATLLALRLRGRRIVVVVHNIAPSVAAIGGQLGRRPGSLLVRMYAMLLRLWPPILHLLASDCIVLEPAVARFISDGGYRRPVTVIPHGIRPQTRDLHRRRAATGVLLVLGFPGWYKGTDLPVTWWEDPATRSLFPEGARLVVAGSPNPVHAGEQNYERYLTDLRHQCHRAGVTYLPEVRTRDIPRLLNTADLLVFPYRALVGGSGLFALAIQHRVPVALSAAVGDWLRAPDCAEALSKAGLEVADLIFSDAASLARLAHDARSPEFHDRIRAMMDILARGRDWSVVASRYHAVLMPPWVTAHTRP